MKWVIAKGINISSCDIDMLGFAVVIFSSWVILGYVRLGYVHRA